MHPVKVTLFLYISTTVCQCISYKNEQISPFTGITFSNSTLYIGGQGGIVSVDKDSLSEISNNTEYTNNWLIVYDNSTNEIVQCNVHQRMYSNCTKLNSTLLYSGVTSTIMAVNVTHKPIYTKVYRPETKSNVVVIAATSMDFFNNTYGILSLNLDNLKLFLTKEYQRGPMNIELGDDFELVFKSSFLHGGYLYFAFQVWNETGEFVSSKLGKLCLNNTNINSNRSYYHSYEDIEIKCNSSSYRILYAGINGENIVTVFTDRISSVICRYKLDDVRVKFLASRKIALTCRSPYVQDRRYFAPITYLGDGGCENCFENGTCAKEDKVCNELQGNFCNTEYHHTIIGNQSIEARPVYVVDKVISAADVLYVHNSTVLYLGTKDGSIGKIYLDSEKDDLVPDFITRYTTQILHINAEENGIYVLTEDEIENIEFEECSLLNNCSSCMLSGNPYCGWDYSEQRCQSNNTRSEWWLPSVSSFCIKIPGLKNSIRIDEGTPNVLRFDITAPREILDKLLSAGKNHGCGIQGSNITSVVKTDSSSFTCSIDLSGFSPGCYTFELKLKNIVYAEQTIEFYRCPNFTECSQCTRRADCYWNVTSFSCDKQGGFQNETYCPRLDNSNGDILFHRRNHPVNYTIFTCQFQRFPQGTVEANFNCELFKADGNEVTELVPLTYNTTDNSVTCLKLNLTSSIIGLTKYRIRVVKKDTFKYVDNEILLNVYYCNGLLEDMTSCGECQHLSWTGYACYWCHSGNICYNPDTENCNDGSSTECIPTISKNETDCPRLDNSSGDILFHRRNHPVNYTIFTCQFQWFPLGTVEANFNCELFKADGNEVTELVPLTYNTTDNSVTCLKLNLTSSIIGLTKYRIRVVKKDTSKYVDNEIILNVYYCNGLLEDMTSCGECQHLSWKGYNCYWCNSGNSCYNPDTENCNDISTMKCIPKISKATPKSGPLNGGTLMYISGENLGNEEDNVTIKIGDVKCQHVNIVQAFTSITCLTGKVSNIQSESDIIITVNEIQNTTDAYHFSYEDPKLSDFKPTKGIVAGNTSVTIFGRDIGFQGFDRYDVSFCNDIPNCAECRITDSSEENEIVCSTSSIPTPQEMTSLHVVIDNLTNLTIQKSFYYGANPTKIALSNNTGSVLQSGGAKIVINGEGFNNVGEVTVDKVVEPCEVPSDTTVVCGTPELELSVNHTSDKPIKQTVNVHFDGMTVQIELEYVGDPVFEMFDGIPEYDRESSIQIKGRNILRGARQDDYSVHIGLDGRCFMNGITMETITCFPPKSTPRTNNSNTNIVFVVVEVGRIKKYIGEIEYTAKIDIAPIVAGILGAAFVASVIVGVTAVMVLRRKKKKAIKEFQMELVSREEMIRKASREEFADAQMTIRDIKTDLVTSKVPYCTYQTYIFHQLFPNQDMESNSLCQNARITDDDKLREKEAIGKLDKLLTNKLFLKSLVQTLDRQQKLTLRERANFASVLSVSLLGNMRLFYDLITCLLVDLIDSTPKRQHKIAFRRFESITLRLTINWLQIVLYEQLKSQSGMQLFLLYKAVQTIVEKAPVDALTGNSKNTLAEEKLLKMRIEYETLTLQIDLNGNSDLHYPVKVLDCDTISQVKQKCCMQIYRNKPASEIPQNRELTLEWHEGVSGKHVLDDIDSINERGNGLVRLNTLKHYMVKDNSRMALMYKEHEEDIDYENFSAYRVQSVTSDDINLLMEGENGKTDEDCKLHLSNLPDDVKSNREQDIGDIFLNRLFHTKLLMTDYIDTTFEGLLDPNSPSVPVRYFMGMIDKLGKDFDVDSDVVQTWKSECYATRAWAQLIAKPHILFDVDVPNYVGPCMDILNQVFIEIFTQSAQKVNKESPAQKLLFHKDIVRYKKLVNPFFLRIDQVTDQEFWSEISDISERQKRELNFSREATLSQLYNLFIGKYKNEIIEDFDEMQDSKDLCFGEQLQTITVLMEES